MVYLELFHGRHSPDEVLDGWGFEGPVLGPYPFVHITYGSDIKTGQKDSTQSLDLFIDKFGLVNFAGAYYGDFSIFGPPTHRDSGSELKRRIKETQKVFQTDLPLLVGDQREWVKIYLEWRLKNDIIYRLPGHQV
jgi:hypothetical protein